jgi:hypothetical protein
MSMEHKAFLFDHRTFTKRLAPILYEALVAGTVEPLIRYIQDNQEHLTDPYEGAPLDAGWRDLVTPLDAHQLGDFALTMFYSPRDNVGLGYEWQAALEHIEEYLGTEAEAVVLGKPFGPPDNPFDPGKMGSYFQSEQTVEKQLTAVTTAVVGGDAEPLRFVSRMLTRAHEARRGLYVTF